MTTKSTPKPKTAPTHPALPTCAPGDSLSARTLEIASHGWDAFLARCGTPEESGPEPDPAGESER